MLEFPQCTCICSSSKQLYNLAAECVAHHELIQWGQLPATSTAAWREEHTSAAEVWLKSHALLILHAWSAGKPVSHPCAEIGDAEFLLTMHCLGVHHDISWTTEDEWGRAGDNVAHIAARKGHDHFIRALHRLGYRKMLSARNAWGWTIAHFALDGLHPTMINTIYALGYGPLLDACSKDVASLRQRLVSLDNRYKN